MTIPVVIFGVTALVAGMVAFLIPETLFVVMHQTIDEAEKAKEDYGIPCCGKPGKKSQINSSFLARTSLDAEPARL